MTCCSCNCAGKPGIAVQLYSVHQFTDKNGLAKTIEEVAKIGYRAVEFAGYWDLKASELKALLDANGLVACGAHVGRDVFEGDNLKKSCEFVQGYGNDLMICPGGGNGIPEGWDKTPDDWWKFLADFYAQAGEEAKKYGCKIGIHNHFWEFQTKLSDGTIFWDHFFSNTPECVCMEQDVGWTTYAGFDPCEQFEKYPHRSPTLHAKENGIPPWLDNGENKPEKPFEGILGQPDPRVKGVEWDRVIDVAQKNGTKWVVVECERHFDSMAAIEQSFAFLRSKGLR